MQNHDNSAAAKLRVMDVISGTTVDGPGFRTSIYFAGCDHHCPGCHNPTTWSHDAGKDMTIGELIEMIKQADFNVTFSGGDPMLQAQGISVLAKYIKELGYNIWCYTGYTIEYIRMNHDMSRLLQWIDVLVDGPYIEALRDSSLIFRGSSNQRLIDLHSSSATELGFWESDF